MNHFVNKNENCKCNGKKSLVRLLLEKKIIYNTNETHFWKTKFSSSHLKIDHLYQNIFTEISLIIQ